MRAYNDVERGLNRMRGLIDKQIREMDVSAAAFEYSERTIETAHDGAVPPDLFDPQAEIEAKSTRGEI